MSLHAWRNNDQTQMIQKLILVKPVGAFGYLAWAEFERVAQTGIAGLEDIKESQPPSKATGAVVEGGRAEERERGVKTIPAGQFQSDLSVASWGRARVSHASHYP